MFGVMCWSVMYGEGVVVVAMRLMGAIYGSHLES